MSALGKGMWRRGGHQGLGKAKAMHLKETRRSRVFPLRLEVALGVLGASQDLGLGGEEGVNEGFPADARGDQAEEQGGGGPARRRGKKATPRGAGTVGGSG